MSNTWIMSLNINMNMDALVHNQKTNKMANICLFEMLSDQIKFNDSDGMALYSTHLLDRMMRAR